MELTHEKTTVQWKTFYQIAALMALLIVLAGLVDTVTSMLAGEARENSTVSVVEWFSSFQNNRFYAFSNLGVINMITLSLGTPIYLALYHAHRRVRPTLAALAAVSFFTGVAIYLSSNTVFSMFALSQQYASASEAQKPALVAAGTALLAQGADLTPGTFMGFFFTQTAGILISIAMLQGRVFNQWAARFGLAGYGITSIFFVLTAFVPRLFDTAMLLAAPGGLLLIVYQILLAREFSRISRQLRSEHNG